MYSYKYLDEVAFADAAFEAWADSWDGLFAAATEALSRVMVELEDLEPKRSQALEMTGASVADLLYDWLAELVYLKDTEGLLVKSADVHVSRSTVWMANGILHGDTLNPDQQRLGQDVKAVTYHLFDVRQSGRDYRARVVLDI